MDFEFSLLYDKTFINAYNDTTELIDEVAAQLVQNGNNVKWNNLSNANGHFFYLTNSDNKKESISFGIWDAIWKNTGSPLSLSVDCSRMPLNDQKELLEGFILRNNIGDCKIVEYEELVNIVFGLNYLQNLKYAREVVELILAVAREFNFNINYNLSRW